MGRILAIDFGLKRSGIAVTDPHQIIAHGLDTVDTPKLLDFLTEYAKRELIDEMVVGYPFLEGSWGDRTFRTKLDDFIRELNKRFPGIPVRLQDERYTSLHAREILQQSGMKKSKRQDKRQLDKTSAVIILQEYLGHL